MTKRQTIDKFTLREKREAAGLRQEDLADLADIDRGLVSKLETGARTNVNLHTAVAIARALGTTVDSLLRQPPLPGDEAREMTEEIVAHLADMTPEQLAGILDYVQYRRRKTGR